MKGIGTSVIRGTPKNLGNLGGGKAALRNGLQILIRSNAHSQALGSQKILSSLKYEKHSGPGKAEDLFPKSKKSNAVCTNLR